MAVVRRRPDAMTTVSAFPRYEPSGAVAMTGAVTPGRTVVEESGGGRSGGAIPSTDHLASSYQMICSAIEIVEKDCKPINLLPKCEPQLGRRGLYSAIGGDKDGPARSMALLWVLNLSDGEHSLLDIAERAELPFWTISEAADILSEGGLLKRS